MVTIGRQFNGPPNSGNGGWVSGLIAAEAAAHGAAHPITTRLATPPPLDVPLVWENVDGVTHLMTHGGALVGSAQPGSFSHDVPPPPSAGEVSAGLEHYPGFKHHPFNTCFTCGTARGEGDGLRLFTGPIDPSDSTRTAGPWHAHEAFAEADGTIGVPVSWAALDCPGGWAADFTVQPMVLGTMTAQVFSAPVASREYRATGQLIERSGRKFTTATALYDGEDLIGRAEQVWIEIDPAKFA